jgi:probable rRNA maturation factor
MYEELFNRLFKKTLSHLKISENSIMSVTFVSKDEIHQINKDYRNIDRPTDVISFAFLDDKSEIIVGDDIPLDLGEIYICYEVADENRKNYNNSIKREICFLFVHGLLHLLGYDHMTKEDEEIMFPLQEVILEGEL